MAEIFGLKDLEARKRALIAESELYRQTLSLEIQNIKVYGARWRSRFALLRLANPLILLAGSFIGGRFLGRASSRRQRRGKVSRMIGASLMGWRLYRRFSPLVQRLLSARANRKRSHPDRAPARPTSRNF